MSEIIFLLSIIIIIVRIGLRNVLRFHLCLCSAAVTTKAPSPTTPTPGEGRVLCHLKSANFYGDKIGGKYGHTSY